MNVSLSLDQIKRLLGLILNRFHLLIFCLTVIIGVSVAILMFSGLLSSSDEIDSAQTQNINFDEETIERIENFNTSTSEEDTFSLPPGRINPLVAE